MRTFTLTICLLVAVLAGYAQKVQANYNKVKNGYNFWLAKPTAGSNAADLKPLVVFLHGASLRGTNLNNVLRYGAIDAVQKGLDLDAYVLAPQTASGWNPQMVMNTIDYVLKTQPDVDPQRVYVLGMSLGGYGTIDVAATYPDRIAAAIAMCGGGTVSNLASLNRLPLWIIHGTADAAVSVQESDKVVSKMRAANPDTPRLVYDRVPGFSHSDPAKMFYMPDTYKWLFSHSLDDFDRTAAPTFTVNKSTLSSAYRNIKSERVVVEDDAQMFLPAGFDDFEDDGFLN